MKSFSADLTALLAAGLPLYRVELFKIGPCLNGSYIYATNGQLPVTYGGNKYQPSTYGSWSRGDVTVKVGLESNTCPLTVFCDNQLSVSFPGTSDLVLMIDGIKFGMLGNAPVTVYTAYMPTYGQVVGSTGGSLVETRFVGMVTNIEQLGMVKAVINVQDMMYLLNIQVPRRIFSASCSHVLYDVGCSLSSASFTKTGTVASVTYPYLFATTAHITPASSSGSFSLGVLTWTSGLNSGLSCFVRAWTAGTYRDSIQLDIQPLFTIAAGDSFTISQGCSKTFASCVDLQGSTNAYLHYGGQPNTPVPETAIT